MRDIIKIVNTLPRSLLHIQNFLPVPTLFRHVLQLASQAAWFGGFACSMKRSPLWTLTPHSGEHQPALFRKEGYQYSGVSSVSRRNRVLSTRFASVWLLLPSLSVGVWFSLHHGNRGTISIQLVGLLRHPGPRFGRITRGRFTWQE
jgi:hypothetical protein